MPRFFKNRLWAFILTLSLCLACWCLSPVGASADGPLMGYGDETGSSGGPAGAGDPDVPTGTGKTSIGRGASQGATYDGMRAAGDGAVSRDVWMIRLRVVLQGMKSFYLRF